MLTFVLLSFTALLADTLSGGAASIYLFSVYRSNLSDPLAYVRIFAHVFGHSSFEHFFNNFLIILLVGPALEERYGSIKMIIMIMVTAILTGLVHITFSSETRLLGASGVAFMMIVLSSFVSLNKGRLPLTFLLCIVAYIGKEISAQLAVNANSAVVAQVSYVTHIVGGFCGAGFGFWLNRDKLFHKSAPSAKPLKSDKPAKSDKATKPDDSVKTPGPEDFIDLRDK